MRSRLELTVLTVKMHMTPPVTSPESQSHPHTPTSLPGAFPRTTGRKLSPSSFSWENIRDKVRMFLSGPRARWAELRPATGLLAPGLSTP